MDTLRWNPQTRPLSTTRWHEAVRAGGAPTVAWLRGDQGQQAWGFGVARQHVASTVEAAAGLIQTLVEAAGVEAQGLVAPGPWFGGVAFPTARGSALWAGFPAVRFVVPQRLLWRVGDHCFETCFADGEEPVPPGVAAWPTVKARRGEAGAWAELVGRATVAFEQGRLRKVVAARGLDVEASHAWDVAAVVTTLAERWKATQVFAVAGTAGSTLVGATPETLLRLDGTTLELDALAGSVAPGAAFGPKEHAEHQHVVDGIAAALQPYCSALEFPAQPLFRELPNIRHLWTPVRATLRGMDVLPAVWTALFPTAAVAGTPRPDALDFIARQEALDRGWYAGAVGALGGGRAHLCVPLRCALLDGATARLFVGAGLVAGSTAPAEWDETQRKAAPMLDALGVGP